MANAQSVTSFLIINKKIIHQKNITFKRGELYYLIFFNSKQTFFIFTTLKSRFVQHVHET
jgi:hypothetical protein